MGNKDLLRKLAEGFDLEDEVLPGMPLVELIGPNRILIENHRGVREFGNDRISVSLQFGLLCIEGSCLQLRRMSGAQLIVYGQIERLTILKGDGRT